MKKIWLVICNCGDGSNTLDVVNSHEVLDKMQELADDGDERYASGDGLQSKELKFPDDFDVDTWVKTHFYGYTTLEELQGY